MQVRILPGALSKSKSRNDLRRAIAEPLALAEYEHSKNTQWEDQIAAQFIRLESDKGQLIYLNMDHIVQVDDRPNVDSVAIRMDIDGPSEEMWLGALGEARNEFFKVLGQFTAN